MNKEVSLKLTRGVLVLGDLILEYGKPCLAAPVPLNACIIARPITANEIRVTIPSLTVKFEATTGNPTIRFDSIPSHLLFIEQVFQLLYSGFSLKKGLQVTIDGDIAEQDLFVPLAVNLIRIVSTVFSLKLSNKRILELVFQPMLDSNLSFLLPDLIATIWDKPVLIASGGEVVEKLEVSHLPLQLRQYVKAEAESPHLLLRQYYKKHKKDIDSVIEEMAGLVERGRTAIERKNWEKLGLLMNKNQKLLQDLALSNEEIHKTCVNTLLAGALGAKMSGNGVVALLVN